MLNSPRICVELDVSKPLLDAILINFIDEVSNVILEQFWVKVFYDEVPLLCGFCCHIGHGMGVCKRRWEEDRSGKLAAEENRSMTGRLLKVWQPVLGAWAASVHHRHGAPGLDAKEVKGDRLPHRSVLGWPVQALTLRPKLVNCQDVAYGQIGGLGFESTRVANSLSSLLDDKEEQLRTQQETLIIQDSSHLLDLQQIDDVEGPVLGIAQHINGAGCVTVNTEQLRLQREKGPEPVRDIIAVDLEPVQCEKDPKARREISASTKFCFAGACEQVAAFHTRLKLVTQGAISASQAVLGDKLYGEVGKSADNGLTPGGPNLSSHLRVDCENVNSFIEDIEDIRQKIDKADFTTIAQIANSPATKVFLRGQLPHRSFRPVPMTDLMEAHSDQVNKKELLKNSWADLADEDSDHDHVTVLPQSKPQGAHKWSTTVQIAQIEMRVKGLPFDDNG
ncbi:hypothetical protein LIER_42891 [Lithospermum erythrorhizon]|uniref:DUF4283 domain-containing protein n=1 Tax=Lithospermum erythrorhizon TaxID=34254 RepID=A0AAV3P7R5_LITER